MFDWLAEKLGLKILQARLDKIEDRMSKLEETSLFILEDFGQYKTRTQSELKLMEAQISKLLNQIEKLINTLESEEGIRRAKSLRTRLRNNQTRVMNARKVA